jgi:serine/threonine-protein kinase
VANPIPERLGKYAISEVIGKGAMGVVYKGFDPHIRRTVALKTIRKELVDDDQGGTVHARFQNEARAAGRLSHPGIVGVYEYGEDEELAFLAMEYVQGNSLREYFNRGTRFEPGDVVSIMVQLLDALGYAHEEGVYHRDVKPANIIIMSNGRLKIADFGIARIDSSNLTQTGAVMGTPGYMAPEQYAGLDVDWRADLFSAGVVLYQLLTGTRPFNGTAEAIAYKICYEAPVPPSQVDPVRAAPEFDAVISMALAKKPEERYRTARLFSDAIHAAHAAPVQPAVSEETIISDLVRTHPGPELSTPSNPRAGSTPPPVRTVPPPGWDNAVLDQVRDQLAPFVGPVAKPMVKRAAASTTDVDALYRILAEQLGEEADRARFLAGRRQLKGVATEPAAATVPVSAERSTGSRVEASVPLTPEAVDNAARLLAPYLGPIAKMVARKAAARASGLRQFHVLLGENLDDADRARFFKDVGHQ